MIKITRKLGKSFRKAAYAFLGRIRKNPHYRFDDNAYYISMGTNLLSITPYYGWKKARAAAKRIHPRAFIMRGDTVNRYIEKAQFEGHRKSWDSYAVHGQEL